MESNRYRDFPIQISRIAPKTRRYHVRVIGPVPGGQPGFNEKETRSYDPAVFLVESGGHSVDLLEAMKNRRVTALQLYQLGTILSDLLLPGSVRERLLQSLNVVRERKQRLRLRLIIEANELVPLPWEYLYLKPPEVREHDDLNFLALQSEISIVRHERIDQAEPRLEQRGQYRLVAALASPSEQPKLKIEEDRRAIERMLEKVTSIGFVEPFWIEGVTRQSLREALRQPADIFHFAGHGYFDGKIGQIILDKGDGKRSDFYNATLLAGLLRQAGVKLAILGACETAQRSDENIWGGVAPALVRAGMAAVVANQYRLQDRNAQPLAEELYRGVLAGDPVDEAVYNARWSIYQQAGLENRDWGAPVLYLRVEDGIIFPRQAISTDSLRTVPRISPTPLLTPLIGRDDELGAAQANLRSGGKYYFYGAYGVGKTSLVTALFTQAVKEGAFSDGYLWFRASDMDVERILEWVASHFPDQKVAQAMGQTAKINALRELLAPRGDLLIGIDEVSDIRVIRALLEAAGNCTLLLNGPHRFHLSGQAQELELTPLTSDEAEHLFVNLAHQGSATAQGNERVLIRKICERMRYLPLAIKLAALKHAEGESLETLWERLQRAPVTIIPEHEEVSAIFETVYHYLQEAPAALLVLVRLVCFPALEAALTPLRAGIPDLDFFQAKDKLVALGLISAAGQDRLSLHPLLGLLAQQKADPQLMGAERERIAGWLLNYAHEHRDEYNSLEREHTNLLSLLYWFEKDRKWDDVVTLMRDLFNYLRVRGQWEEVYQRLNTILCAVEGLSNVWNRGWVYLHRGIVHLLRANYDEAGADFTRADAQFAEVNDQVYRGKTLYRQAILSMVTGQLPKAQEQLGRALEWMGDDSFTYDRAGAHERLANILAMQGNLGEAKQHYSLALELGGCEEQARVHIALGDLELQAGKYDESRKHFECALDLTTQLGHALLTASIEQELGYVHYYQGRYVDALRSFEAAHTIFQQLKYQLGVAQTLHALGNVALARHNLDEASQHYQAALAINQALHHEANAVFNRYQLGVVAHRKGRYEEAMDSYHAVLTDAKEMKDVALQAAALLQLGSLAIEKGVHEPASYFLTQASELAGQVKDRITEVSALYYQGVLQAQEGRLDSARDTFVAAHAGFVALGSVGADIAEQALTELAKTGPFQIERIVKDRIDVVKGGKFIGIGQTR